MSRSGAVYVVGGDCHERRAVGVTLNAAGFSPHPYPDSRCFLDHASFLQPGCLLLDMRAMERDGLNVLAELGGRLAQFPVVATDASASVATAMRAIRMGASDFVEKPFETDTLIDALDRAFAKLDGQVRTLNRQSVARAALDKLSPREMDVLRGLMEGHSNKALAFALGLGVRTIETYRANMLQRLGVKTLSGALSLVFQADINGLPPSSRDTREIAFTANAISAR